MANRFYIRNRGKRMGPLSVERLQAMAKRGRFGRHFEVSTDGKRWSSAEDYPELLGQGGGAIENDEWDDMPAANDNFEDAPIVDDIDAPLIDEPVAAKPSERRGQASAGRSSRRSAATGGRRTGSRGARVRPEHERPSARRRRRSPPEESEIVEADIVEDVAPERPVRRPKNKGAKPTQIFKTAGRKDGGKKKASSDKVGFFGRLFGGSGDSVESLPGYIRKLTQIHGNLKSPGFRVDDLMFVGSGGEKISVGQHLGSGDGPHVLGLLTAVAFQSRTTDMHFEPTDDSVDVRMRIDGALVPLVKIPKEHVKRLYGIIKILCETKMGASQEVLEGNYSSVAPGRRSDYRVSFTPSVHGQKLAIRVLDADNAPQKLNQLGLPKRYVETIRHVMDQNAGMVLMCGPTGSGKTTTLYSMLRSVDFQSRNVMTLEDPVEYQIDGITQINIDSDHGRGFGEMLPALLRQDPDVLLIGEIRDGISAKIAMQATMTGHLVLSTVHAPDTLATVHRLLDLNADPTMVASSLDLVLSQRLLKTLCQDCRARRRPTAEDKQLLGDRLRDAIYEPRGCQSCLGTGYSGRRAIFELLDVKNQLGSIIHKSPGVIELREAVRGKKFMSLRQHGYSLVASGSTTYSEVDRVIGANQS